MYLLFYGDTYYPAKWDDFRGKFDTIDLCIGHMNDLDSKHIREFGYSNSYDWYQIVDLKTLTVVKEG